MGTGNFRRIQRISVAVEQQCKVMYKKCKFPEGGSVFAPDDSFCSMRQRLSGSDIVEGSPRFLYD